jgi:phosphotriesterase-related protein
MENMVYAHEHITIDLAGQKNDPDCRLDDREAALVELKRLSGAGVRAIIDQTNRGMGRDTLYTQSLADEAGLQVLHATGYYKEPFLPEECHTKSENELCGIMLAELSDGIGETGIKASFVGEIGTSLEAIMPIEEKIFRAAARAYNETGAPICTHTTLGLLGMEQVAIFREYGVDLSRVVISHLDLTGDVKYMRRLLDTGVNIAFDTVGKLSYQPDTGRAEWLAFLCAGGYAGQIVLSMDITRKSHYAAGGGLGYAYLIESFLPMARAAGCSDADLKAMLTENPWRIYSGGRAVGD